MQTRINLLKSRTYWSMSLKLKRGVWTYILEPLVRWLPKFASPLRVSLLRLMGASIGKRCLIMPGVKVLMPWNLMISDYVVLGEMVNVYNFAPVKIETMTVVSQNCFLCTGSHNYRLPEMPLTYFPITIGSECWIAAGVFIAPGVSIADGVVVGAMSVVPKSITEPWSIHAGNPCLYRGKRTMQPD